MNKTVRKQEGNIPWINLLIYLFSAYVFTIIILLLLAMLLYKVNLSVKVISACITIMYVLATFLAGTLAGKRMKQKRFVWGLVMGVAYYLVLLLMSIVVNHSFAAVTDSVFTCLILCAGGGMLGGMLS